MIYLIDDDQGDQRRRRHNVSYLDTNEFSAILSDVRKLNKGADLSFLANASCILLHASTEDIVDNRFLKGSISNAIRIKEEVAREGEVIPLVVYSNGIDKIDFPNDNYIRSINKNLFYDRLFDFLVFFQKFGKIELNIFAHGKSFHSAIVADYIHILMSDLHSRKQDDLLKLSDIKVGVFEKLVNLSSTKMTFSDLLIYIEDEPITIGKYLRNLTLINESFAKYGENIFGWIK